jgi:DNA-binding CsgD family transcriptional regulator
VSAVRHEDDSVPEEFAALVPEAVANVNVPAYIVDRSGGIRWLNAAARRLVGEAVGLPFTAVVGMGEAEARSIFGRNLVRPGPHDRSVTLMRANKTSERVDLSSVPLGDGHQAVGMFGLAILRTQRTRAARVGRLTPRQYQVLDLLADGVSTDAIAAQLVLSPQTVRNHVREILRRLDARTRLEAVANARRAGLV